MSDQIIIKICRVSDGKKMILISTTMVEVGINPKRYTMVIGSKQIWFSSTSPIKGRFQEVKTI